MLLYTLATVAYAVYAVLRHLHYESKAFDMGIYDQVVWFWSRFQLPANTIQDFPHELGDHFSPVYALFAPSYWIHSGPIGPLIGQAILIGISIVGVDRVARRRLGAWGGLAVAAGYALSWGVWAAVDWDFHETAFAAALLPWAIDAADEMRWRRCALLLAALLLVKEDMGLVVAAFGLWLLTRGCRRQGLIALAGGSVAYVVINALVMPALNGGHPSTTDQRIYGELGSSALAISWHVVSHPAASAHLITHPSGKLQLLGLCFGAFLFLGLLSPMTLITLPQFAERLLTTDHHYWAPQFHYTLAVAPVLAVAAADGRARLKGWLGDGSAARITSLAAILGILLFGVGSAVTGVPKRLFQSGFYEKSAADRARDAAIARVPASGSVTASDDLLPHVSARSEIYPLTPWSLRNAEWLVSEQRGQHPVPGWTPVFRRDGVVVMHRTGAKSDS